MNNEVNNSDTNNMNNVENPYIPIPNLYLEYNPIRRQYSFIEQFFEFLEPRIKQLVVNTYMNEMNVDFMNVDIPSIYFAEPNHISIFGTEMNMENITIRPVKYLNDTYVLVHIQGQLYNFNDEVLTHTSNFMKNDLKPLILSTIDEFAMMFGGKRRKTRKQKRRTVKKTRSKKHRK